MTPHHCDFIFKDDDESKTKLSALLSQHYCDIYGLQQEPLLHYSLYMDKHLSLHAKEISAIWVRMLTTWIRMLTTFGVFIKKKKNDLPAILVLWQYYLKRFSLTFLPLRFEGHMLGAYVGFKGFLWEFVTYRN